MLFTVHAALFLYLFILNSNSGGNDEATTTVLLLSDSKLRFYIKKYVTINKIERKKNLNTCLNTSLPEKVCICCQNRNVVINQSVHMVVFGSKRGHVGISTSCIRLLFLY